MKYFYIVVLSVFFVFPLFANEQKASDWMSRGIRELKLGNYAKASKWLGKAADAFTEPSQKSRAYFHQGMAYFNWEQWGGALESFENAKRGAPDDLKQDLYYYIGYCYDQLAHRDESLSYLTVAAKSASSPDIRYKSDFLLNRLRKHKRKKFSVLANLGYLFDSNVILETPSGHIHGNAGLDAEYHQGYGVGFSLKPAYFRPVFKKSELSVQALFHEQWYLINSLEQFNYMEIAPSVGVTTPIRVKHVPVRWNNTLSYQVVFNTDFEDTNEVNFDTIKNVYLASTSAKFLYSSEWDLTWGISGGYLDNKEGKGSIQSTSGIIFRTALVPVFKTSWMMWSPGFSYSTLVRTGEKNKYRKSELSLKGLFSFFFESLLQLDVGGHYTRFPDHQSNRRDVGWMAGARLSRPIYGRLAGVAHTRYTVNRGRHVDSSFDRYTLGIDLSYLFD